MSDKLTQDIQSVVDDIFRQKEELDMREQTEKALNESAEKINELVTSLEAKDEELSEFTSKIEELELTVSEVSKTNKELEENLEKATSDFEAEKKELIKRAEMVEEDLENIKKDQLTQARFEELKGEGVSAVDEEAVKDQVAKIREMDDEEFAAYKTDRIELRKSVITELELSSELKTDEKLEAEEEAARKEAEEIEAARIKAEEEAAAISDSPIEPMKAMAALLNMEVAPGDDILNKYKELGKAMAKGLDKSVDGE
jgi:chromosome segregation ATPase